MMGQGRNEMEAKGAVVSLDAMLLAFDGCRSGVKC